jgi:hypothetical protein
MRQEASGALLFLLWTSGEHEVFYNDRWLQNNTAIWLEFAIGLFTSIPHIREILPHPTFLSMTPVRCTLLSTTTYARSATVQVTIMSTTRGFV